MRAALSSHTFIVLVMAAVIVGLPMMAVAAPSITIYTDSDTYVAGDTIEISLSAQNPGAAREVDAYVGLIFRPLVGRHGLNRCFPDCFCQLGWTSLRHRSSISLFRMARQESSSSSRR